MTWGARTLVRAATTALLLQLATWCTVAAAALKPWVMMKSINATAVTVAAKPRQASSDSEILIEHIDDGDAAVLMPLLVDLLVLGAFMFLVLLLLACILLSRLLESRRSAKYHRLHCSEDSETFKHRRHRSRTGRNKQSQVFTYVDLSNADCSCPEQGTDGGKQNQQQAPRFAVQFQSATNVDVNDENARRKHDGIPAPAPRRSRMATMGMPSGEKDAAEDAKHLRRAKMEESNARPTSESANAPSDRLIESPTLRMYAENAARGSPGTHGDYVGEAEEFDTYRERCAKLTSVVPQMEIQVRDRYVKKHPSSGAGVGQKSPRGYSDREVQRSMTAHTTEASSKNYPDFYISLPSELGSPRESNDVGSDVQSSPMFSPNESVASAPASGYPSGTTSPFRAEDARVSSYGRYHKSRDDDEAGEAANTGGTQRPTSKVSPTSTEHKMLPTAESPTKPGHPVSALIELPDTRVAPRDDSTVKLSNSARLRELFEREAAKTRQSDVTIRTASSHSSGTLSSSTGSSKELSVQVPQMVAYFDHAQTGKPLKATSEGTSETQVATRCPSTDAPLTTLPEAQLPAPVSSIEKTMASTGTIKLPQPPIERSKKEMHVRLPDEELAARSESSQPPKARNDDQSSTEPFSIDEMSRQRASASEPLSDTDILSDRVDARNIAVLPPSVPPRSKPLFVSSGVQVSKNTVMSTVEDQRKSLSAAAEEHEVRERGPSQLLKPGASPRRQSIDTYSKSAAPYAVEDNKPVDHVDRRVGRSKDTAAVVSPFDSPESAAHISPEAHSRVEKTSVALPSSLPLKEADTARPVAAEGDLIEPSAKSDAVLEASVPGRVAQRGGDSETGINESMTAVPTQDIGFPREHDVAPINSNAKEDEDCLTPKQPLEFPLSSESEGTTGLIEAHNAEKGTSDLVQPLTPDEQKVVLDKKNLATLRYERGVPASQQEPTTVTREWEYERQLLPDYVSHVVDKRQDHLLTNPAQARAQVSEAENITHKGPLTRSAEADEEHREVTSYGVRNLEGRPPTVEADKEHREVTSYGVRNLEGRPPTVEADKEHREVTSYGVRNLEGRPPTVEADKEHGEVTSYGVRNLEGRPPTIEADKEHREVTSYGVRNLEGRPPTVEADEEHREVTSYGVRNLEGRPPTVEADKEHGEVTSYGMRNLEGRPIRETVLPLSDRPPAMYSAPPHMILRAPVPSSRNQTDAALSMRAQHKVPDKTTEERVRDAGLEQKKLITSTGNDTRLVTKPDIDIGGLHQRVPHQVQTRSEDSERDVVEYDSRRRSLSEASPASVPDQRVPYVQKDGMVLSRTEHDAPVDRNQGLDVNVQQTEVAGRQTASANEPILRVPTETYPRKSATIAQSATSEQETVAVKGSLLPSLQHGEHTAVDDTTRPNLEEKSVKEPIAPSMQRPPVTSMTPPQMLLFGPVPNFRDGTNTALMSRQEYTVPGETAGGPFKEVVPVHAVPVTKKENEPPMTHDPDIGIANIAQEPRLGVRQSDSDPGGPVAPYDSEGRSLAEPAPSPAPEKWTPSHKRDDNVSNRVEEVIPADRGGELTDQHVGPISGSTLAGPIETHSSASATSAAPATAEDEIIPRNRQPLLTVRDDKDTRVIDEAPRLILEDKPVKFSAPSSTEPPPVMDIPPPQMLLSGPLPNFWGGTNALISRDEYTVPGEITGGPFSAAGRGPSVDSESPGSPGSQFPADHRLNTEGSTAAEQRGNMMKTARRRSSWSDSFQSRPPSAPRSLHSSVELSRPTNDNLSDVHSTTTFLSDTVPGHEVDERRGTPDAVRSDVSRNAESPVEGAVVSSKPSPPRSVEARDGTVLQSSEKSTSITAHDKRLVLPGESHNSPEGSRAPQESEGSLLKRGDTHIGNKLQPRLDDDVTSQLLAALETPSRKATAVSSPMKSPSNADRYDVTTTLEVLPKSNVIDPRREQQSYAVEKTTQDVTSTSMDTVHGTPSVSLPLAELGSKTLAGLSADQRELEAHADAGSRQQENMPPVERSRQDLSSAESQADQLTSVPKQALAQVVSQHPAGLNTGGSELEVGPTHQPVAASHLQPKLSLIEKRKQEFLANANRSLQPKIRSGQALAEPAKELPITPQRREMAKPHPVRENMDALWQAKWSPTERSSQESSPTGTPKKQLMLLPNRNVSEPNSEKPVVVSGNQREMAVPPSRQLDADSSRQPKWYPIERTVTKPPSTVSPYKPSSVHAMTQTPPPVKRPAKVKADRPRLVKPPGAEIVIDESKPPAVQAAADSSTVAVRSRDERGVVHDSSTTSRVIRPSEELEHGKSVAPLEARPAPSEAMTSQPITEEDRAKSLDVFFGKATPVPAQGSKDLMQFKPEQTTEEGAPEEKITKKLSESHTAEKADQEDSKDSTTESKK